MSIKKLCIGIGILLLLAISPWSSVFYILLRWVICVSAIIIAYNFYTSKLQAWTLIFGAVAFLFNPLIPIYLNKSSWVPIDFISAMLFFIAAYSVKKKK